MILALDVVDDSECDGKLRSQFTVENIVFAYLVLTVQQDVKNVLFFLALGVVSWIGTPYPVEIAIAKEGNQPVVLAPAVFDVSFAARLARDMIETVRQDQRQEIQWAFEMSQETMGSLSSSRFTLVKMFLLVVVVPSIRSYCPRRESNPHLRFRKPSFYPLNYGDLSRQINRAPIVIDNPIFSGFR
jgi:hypothetical protein